MLPVIVAEAGPWDLVLGIITLIGTVVVAVIGIRANGRARTAVSGVASVREAVGQPNGLGPVTEAIGKVHASLAAIATTTSDHANLDARFHEEARAAFDRQAVINDRQAAINERVLRQLDITAKAAEAAAAKAAVAVDVAAALAVRVAELERRTIG